MTGGDGGAQVLSYSFYNQQSSSVMTPGGFEFKCPLVITCSHLPYSLFKAIFSFHKITTKTLKCLPYIAIIILFLIVILHDFYNDLLY